jgi:hypothetical protein
MDITPPAPLLARGQADGYQDAPVSQFPNKKQQRMTMFLVLTVKAFVSKIRLERRTVRL